ncbi:nitrogen regulation protein NR(II) [candidate division CSSED10-310 bacterium]|uniref:histidine kinase n=1 Tax=candidate division CSSED10-310 bacterium TaxID=2855610 RepID=A0ABV6Z4Z3_UNCC1
MAKLTSGSLFPVATWRKLDQWAQVFGLLGLLVLMAISLGLANLFYTTTIRKLFTTEIDKALVGFQVAESLETSLINQKGFVTYYSLDGNAQWLERLRHHHQQFEINLRQSQRTALDEDTAGILKRINQEYKLYTDSRQRLIALYRRGEKEAGLKIHPKVRIHFYKILELCTQYKNIQKENINRARNQSISVARTLSEFSLVSISIVLFLTVILSVYLVKKVIGPIRRLTLETNPYKETPKKGDVINTLSTQVHGLLRDVGDTRSELERSKEMLWHSEKMALIGKLAAEVAHSIRNPMTSIKMRLFTLERHLDLAPQHKEDLEVVSAELRRLDKIVQNFLEFSRRPKLRMIKVNLSGIITKSLELLRTRLELSQVKVERVCRFTLPQIDADPELMKEVFVNILLNACEAMKNGGSLTVVEEEVVAEEIGRAISVKISDTGPGIPEEYKESILEPFFSTKDDGTGLGLAIAQKIINEHRGDLEFQSFSGRGTSFIVILPLENV